MSVDAAVIAAVVLAAGGSTRFGSQKLLAPLLGRPVVRWSVERVAAAGVDDVVVVLGREAEAVRGAIAGLPVRCISNPRYAAGMSTSLHAGIAALAPGTTAAVIALGDQPSVEPAVIGALIAAYRASGAAIVAPEYEGVRGNPVLFDASVFGELLATAGDEGARGVIARDAARVRLVRLPFAAPPDVDTPADCAAIARVLAGDGREAF